MLQKMQEDAKMSNIFWENDFLVNIEGGIIKIKDGENISRIDIPCPILMADNERESEVHDAKLFTDSKGNEYELEYWSGLSGLHVTIKPTKIVDEKHVDMFRKNAKITFLSKNDMNNENLG
jgi:hypothetical protein